MIGVIVLIVIAVIGSLNQPDETADASQSAAPTSDATSLPTDTSGATATEEATQAPTPEPTKRSQRSSLAIRSSARMFRPARIAREPSSFCYWERLSGFGGPDEIIANGNGEGYFTVTIAPTDAGFGSEDCGTWTADLSAVTDDPAGPIAEGWRLHRRERHGTWAWRNRRR